MNKIANVTTDFVVEQGAYGIWTYRKWDSGIMEAWGKFSYTGKPIGQGYVYYYYTNDQQMCPGFKTITNGQITVDVGRFGIAEFYKLTTSVCAGRIVFPWQNLTDTSLSCTCRPYVIGTWK